MIPKALSLKDHKKKAKKCGCIMCMMMLKNIESSVHYYAMSMDLTEATAKRVNIYHRAWARANRQKYINDLRMSNALPEEFHGNNEIKNIQPQK